MCFKTKGLFKCGKCPECLAERQNSWSLRLIEYARHNSCFSALLTYDPKYVPMNGDLMSLRKSDVQKFLKRLRHEFPESKIKYYIGAEYSPEKFRPHYHCLFFGFPPNLSKNQVRKKIKKAWGLGIIGSQSNWLKSNAQINYALGYFIYLYDWNKDDIREKPFSLISKGLSLDWFGDEYNDKLAEPLNYVTFFYDDIIYDDELKKFGSVPKPKKLCKDVLDPFYFEPITGQLKLIPELEFLENFDTVVLPQSKFNRLENKTIDLPPKRFRMPRSWRKNVISPDIQRILNFYHNYKNQKNEELYLEKYGEYDKNSDFPMWKQIKYQRWSRKKKNKKDKLLSDPMTYF